MILLQTRQLKPIQSDIQNLSYVFGQDGSIGKYGTWNFPQPY